LEVYLNRVTLFCLSLALCCASAEAKKPPKPANFSGTWALDFTQSKNLPRGLENYRMVINQNPDELAVKTSVEGSLNRRRSSNAPSVGGEGTGYPGGGNPGGYPGGGYPGGGYPGGGYPGGMGRMGRMGIPGVGFPGGRRGGYGGGGGTRVEAAAFTLYPTNAVFLLRGTKSAGKLGGQEQSDATLMASWAKKGKILTLEIAGDGGFGMGGGQVKIKDQWKFSKDGQSLMVDRSVHTPSGSKTLHLFFYGKQAN
jgi:hypothetical protein